ncbi:hypothetical protein BAG01nite_31440 [Brevibacillus agri]|uniref:Uncharacterized protein n=1 Tax=Brevibacillus agri TaxID=51101 RepID=A0ABQ0ST14_9BACL|nr:hypothetical protein BAG01nite_31440 [Brevibacillus agri]
MAMKREESQQTYLKKLQQRPDVQAVLVLPVSDLLVPFRDGAFYFCSGQPAAS